MVRHALWILALVACGNAGDDTDDTNDTDPGDTADDTGELDSPGLFSDAITTVVLEVDIAQRTGLALLDRNRLEAGLLDLVSNARAAIPDQGTISLRVSSVTLDAERAAALGCGPGSYELIEIQDTGTGIREEHQPRVFERHFTTKPGGRGSGLGLTHVRHFVRESRGTIAVTSAPGAGSTFALYFPQMSPEATHRSADATR